MLSHTRGISITLLFQKPRDRCRRGGWKDCKSDGQMRTRAKQQPLGRAESLCSCCKATMSACTDWDKMKPVAIPARGHKERSYGQLMASWGGRICFLNEHGPERLTMLLRMAHSGGYMGSTDWTQWVKGRKGNEVGRWVVDLGRVRGRNWVWKWLKYIVWKSKWFNKILIFN